MKYAVTSRGTLTSIDASLRAPQRDILPAPIDEHSQFLTAERLSKAIAIENDLRGTLRNFGLKVGMVGKVRLEARIQELVENIPDLAVLVEPLLIVRRVLREQIVILHRRLLR